MGHKYVVLGAGRQGVAAAYDLAVFGQAESLVLLDIDLAVAQAGAARLNGLLKKPIASAFQVDAGDVSTVAPHLDGATGLISSVHYVFNLEMTKLAIAKKVHMTDFGGNTDVVRRQLALDGEAAAAGVTIVPDCGMGPGLNISLATYVMELVEKPEEVLIWDGGLPQDPQEPWNYVSTFNLGGLTNEYDGNAFFLRDGQVTPVPCFSGYEVLEFPAPLGETRGVRDLRRPLDVAVDVRGPAEPPGEQDVAVPGPRGAVQGLLGSRAARARPDRRGRAESGAARRVPHAARAADLPQRGEGRLRDEGEGHRHDEGQARRGHGRTRGSLRRARPASPRCSGSPDGTVRSCSSPR